MAVRDIKVIANRFTKGQQSLNLEVVVAITCGERRETLKVEIKRDSHDFQSYARGYIYGGEHKEWNKLVDLPITECCCQVASPYEQSPLVSNFEADAKEILSEMALIISLDGPDLRDVDL